MTEPFDVPVAPRSAVLCAAWATPADVPEKYRPYLSDVDEWHQHLMLASEILWALSGRRWYGGGCTESATFRDACSCCGQQVLHSDGSTWWIPPYGFIGRWQQQHSKALKLPRSPVTSITAFTIGGEPYSDYWLDTQNGSVYRMDGCGWSVCSAEIAVTYTHGEPPPEGGVRATVALAVQLMLSSIDSGECSLPERVQSVTRQGISMTVLDPMEFLPNGKTGLYEVDLWLTAVNPKGRAESGSVWSPDVPRLRR